MTPAPTAPSKSPVTTAAGWIAVAFGTVHVVVAPLDTSATWKQVWAEGWWNTFTLDSPTTFGQAERSSVFWTTLGSFGVPILALGCHILWSAHRHQRVPGWLGWLVLVWGVAFVTALPASPGWTIPVIGALVIAGDRPRRPGRPVVATTPAREDRERPDVADVPRQGVSRGR
jgi:hypothetical protein